MKAALRLLFAAWRGAPAGSIPASHSYVASATGMSEDFVSKHYVMLTEGFEIQENGRLYHIEMSKLCARMSENYGKEIEAYALATAMAAQDPEQFGIASVEATTKRPRGMTMLPKGFGYMMFPDLRGWAAENGYMQDFQQDEIMDKFIDFATARGDKQKDWVAAFRNYARNEISRFRRYPSNVPPMAPQRQQQLGGMGVEQSGAVKPGAFAGLQRRTAMPGVPMSKGDQIAANNLAKLERSSSATMGYRS